MNIAIILAGGTGSRINSDIPKQFILLSGQMMILHSLKPFGESALVDRIRIVAADEWREKIENEMFSDPDSEISRKFLGFSDPGENRQMSIYNAMKDLQGDVADGRTELIDGIIIHDAARPFVTVKDIDECLKALDEHEGAMPVLPMSDTVYFSRSGKKVDELLNRNCIYAGQAPEAFRFKEYLKANEELLPDRILLIRGSTEPAIMAGLDVAMIPGDRLNFKVTTDEDLQRAIELIEREN